MAQEHEVMAVTHHTRRCEIAVEWGRGSDIPDGAVQAIVESCCDLLMELMLRLGVTDPSVSASLNAPKENER